MAYSTFKTAADLFNKAEKQRARLSTFDCRPDEIPDIINQIERTHKRMLELDCKFLQYKLKHPNVIDNTDPKNYTKLLEIINKYLKYHRTDEDDRNILPANEDQVQKVVKINTPIALHMTAVLQFNQEKAEYVNRVRHFLTDLKNSVSNHVFDEKRLKWVHESEHQPRWLEYDLVEGHTPWEMKKVQTAISETLKTNSAVTDSEILQCFSTIATLFDKAMHPGPSLLRSKMLVDTREFYQQQMFKINLLSFTVPAQVQALGMEPVRV